MPGCVPKDRRHLPDQVEPWGLQMGSEDVQIQVAALLPTTLVVTALGPQKGHSWVAACGEAEPKEKVAPHRLLPGHKAPTPVPKVRENWAAPAGVVTCRKAPLRMQVASQMARRHFPSLR